MDYLQWTDKRTEEEKKNGPPTEYFQGNLDAYSELIHNFFARKVIECMQFVSTESNHTSLAIICASLHRLVDKMDNELDPDKPKEEEKAA